MPMNGLRTFNWNSTQSVYFKKLTQVQETDTFVSTTNKAHFTVDFFVFFFTIFCVPHLRKCAVTEKTVAGNFLQVYSKLKI